MGAVYVSGVMVKKEFNALYPKQRLKSEYSHSKEYDYQAIIPMHNYARLELKTYIPVHEPAPKECRWTGLWTPYKGAPIYKTLKKPVFV